MPGCDLCESPLTCHSEGAKRAKNLVITRKYKILRSAPDDKMALRRDFKLRSVKLENLPDWAHLRVPLWEEDTEVAPSNARLVGRSLFVSPSP